MVNTLAALNNYEILAFLPNVSSKNCYNVLNIFTARILLRRMIPSYCRLVGSLARAMEYCQRSMMSMWRSQ